VVDLVSKGLSGACTTDMSLEAVAEAVLTVAAVGVALPPEVVSRVVTQWRSAGSGSLDPLSATKLTLREMEVLNAMADGLSTKAAGRLLGMATKTVENHKTRIFAKLGVRSQAQLVTKRHSELPG